MSSTRASATRRVQLLACRRPVVRRRPHGSYHLAISQCVWSALIRTRAHVCPCGVLPHIQCTRGFRRNCESPTQGRILPGQSLSFVEHDLFDVFNMPPHRRLCRFGIVAFNGGQNSTVSGKRFMRAALQLQRTFPRFAQQIHENVEHLQHHTIAGSQRNAVVEFCVLLNAGSLRKAWLPAVAESLPSPIFRREKRAWPPAKPTAVPASCENPEARSPIPADASAH